MENIGPVDGINCQRTDKIADTLMSYISNNEIAGAVLMVRKNDKIVYDSSFGYADIDKKILVNKDSIFRLASMTKPIIGIAVMQLVEQGKINLYDEISKYIPEFENIKVCAKNLAVEMHLLNPNNSTGKKAQEEIQNMEYVPAKRAPVILELLNHSSGLGMGPVSGALAEKLQGRAEPIIERVRKYANIPLDFQPGTCSGYSPVIAFEVLSAIVELVSNEELEAYLIKNIFEPLKIKDITFIPRKERQENLVRLYENTNKKLIDVSDTSRMWFTVDSSNCGFCSGAAGLTGSMEDYEKIVHMLLNKGTLNGVRILKSETVEMMAGKDIPHNSVMMQGTYWGLSMVVMENPELCGRQIPPGSFGWSGAFGTHFYVNFTNNLEIVLGINQANIGGADSEVSRAVEKAVAETYIR